MAVKILIYLLGIQVIYSMDTRERPDQ